MNYSLFGKKKKVATTLCVLPEAALWSDRKILTRLCRVQHQPANGNIAVPQTVEQFGNVVQDDLLPEKTFL